MGASASVFPMSFRCTRVPVRPLHLISEGAKGGDQVGAKVSCSIGQGQWRQVWRRGERMLKSYCGPRLVLR